MNRSRRARILLAVLVLACLAPTAVSAQEQPLQVRITQVDDSAFPQVTIYISVTDAGGEPAAVDPGLIRLEEDGVVIEPDQVLGSGEAGPLTTLLVMDVSGSMNNRSKLAAAKTAALAYVAHMRPIDQAGLMTFNTRVSTLQPVTSDREALETAISSLTAEDDTAMYDALAQAVETLAGLTGRKAIIVLTDGLDNRSQVTAEQLFSLLGSGGVSISTIALGDPAAGRSLSGLDETSLRLLAERAGGVFGYAEDEQSLQALYEAYGRALQSEYRITYTSPSGLRDGLARTLTVSLAEPGSAPAASQYNPGGVLPEVSGSTWALFLGVLAGLVLLGLLPALFRHRPGRKLPPKRGRKPRIKFK